MPSLGSVLYAKIIPPVGGDTLFANQYMAYETLSDGMKAMLDGMVAVHSNGRILRTLEETRSPRRGRRRSRPATPTAGPSIRWCGRIPKPAARRCSSTSCTPSGFKGMTVEESQPLLRYLYNHGSRPEFTCRFRWRVGSVAFWDNRSVQHLALNDYPGQRRLMHRVQIKGTKPV